MRCMCTSNVRLLTGNTIAQLSGMAFRCFGIFSKPLSEIVESIRSELVKARGHISDIQFAYPGWGEHVESVEGLLTCGISYLYKVARNMEEHEKLYKDYKKND
jgi:hypothetical protein